MRTVAIATVLWVSACSGGTATFEVDSEGAIVRGRIAQPTIALVFTGDEYADGARLIADVLKSRGIKASFFLTGRFYRNPEFSGPIRTLVEGGHYLGAHSDRHLLYCAWEDRDSLLVTHEEFERDVLDNYTEMARFGVERKDAPFFLPAYEWYNRQIAEWTEGIGLTLVNYTPGTRSHADYTTPDMGERYVSSETIMQSILSFEEESPSGLNGFLLLMHIGTAPERTDKLYRRLDSLIAELEDRDYEFKRIDEILKP